MLKIMYSGPSFVIFGLEEINRASLQEVLVAFVENSLTSKVLTLSLLQKHMFTAPPALSSIVRISNLKDFKHSNSAEFLKLGVVCIYSLYNMHADMYIVYAWYIK